MSENRELIKVESQLSLMQQAEILVRSGTLPPALNRVEKVAAVILRGKELGIAPMEALTSINIIQGKVTSSTQLMLALIYRSGLLEDIEMIRADPAKCVMKRKGMTAHTVEFGTADAKPMGLMSKDTYRKFPTVMFLWRAIAMCERVVFPDVIGAVYTPDELGVEIQSDSPEIEEQPLTISNTPFILPSNGDNQVKQLMAEGKTAREIAIELGLPLPQVLQVMKEI